MTLSPTTDHPLSTALHPIDTLCELVVHAIRGQVNRPAMAGQDPLESVMEEPLHRFDLLAPGVPAGTSEGDEAIPRFVPGQMVAREEKPAAIEIDGVTAGVAGCGNHEQIGLERGRI